MELVFNSPGPVSSAFLNDRSSVAGIMGPVGSAKTSTCIMRLVATAMEQKPSPVDGIRRTKWGVVRDTYRNLNRTTVRSFKTWLPKAEWTGGMNEPATMRLYTGLGDGTAMEMIVEMMALGENTIEDVARGWEGTGVWLNEGDLLPPDVLSYMFGRCGRYPSALHGGPSWSGAILDYNAPDVENYCYAIFEEMRPEGYRLFRQPGGRDPRAENLKNLPAGYYDNQVKMLLAQGRDDLVRRLVDNLYGYSRDGKPVYGEYRDDFHCAGVELQPVSALVVKVDFDQGLHPACTLRQTMPDGQRRVLDELYSDRGAVGLCEELRRLIGSAKYAGCRVIGGMVDPSASAGDANDAESWVDCINRLMGWTGPAQVRLAPTNAPDKRQSAVRYLLRTNVGEGRPGLLISSTCRVLRRGFNSEYKYKRKKVAGSAQYDEAPDKKFPVADVHDSLQYGALDDGGFEEVVGREQRAKRAMGSGTRKARVEVKL